MKTIPRLLFLTLVLTLNATPVAAVSQPPQVPNVTFELLTPLPTTLNVGETFTVAVRVTSEAEYLFAMAMPAPEYPGRYVVFEGGDRSGRGASAILYLTLRGKGSTLADFPGGVPIHFVVAARFKNGVTASQWYDFHVVVP